MLRCSWCMKKLNENEPCLGLGVKFAPGVDLLDEDGGIISLYLNSRNTSVPIIITAAGSQARKEGQDGIFVLCSEKCGEKMKKAVEQELEMFSSYGDILRLT